MSRRSYAYPFQCPDCGQVISQDIQARRWNLGGYGMHEHQPTEAERVIVRRLIVREFYGPRPARREGR